MLLINVFVILSEVTSARSGAVTQSKDPFLMNRDADLFRNL